MQVMDLVEHYIAEKWQDILVFNNLDTRDKVWALETEWFEKPNYCRGGWSGVARLELMLPLGGKVGVFLKRQENHMTRSLKHPVAGIATFAKEFNLINKFAEKDIPSLDVVCFEQWASQGNQRAFIMTEELDGYLPLSSDAYKMGGKILHNKAQQDALFHSLADLMRRMHDNHFKHNCFYPNHVFAKQIGNGQFKLKVIDLEKVKKVWFKESAAIRDLSSFCRHASSWSTEDKQALVAIYLQEPPGRRADRLWKKVSARINKKMG